MKSNRKQERKFESPIEGLSQDDFEFAVELICAVEFGHQEWYGRGAELKERGISLNDYIDDRFGRLNEILAKLDMPYATLYSICFEAVHAKHEEIKATVNQNK